MMKLTKHFLLAILLLIPLESAWAQITNPVSPTFAIRRANNAWPPDYGLSGMFPSVSLWERTDSLNMLAYTTNRGEGLDSVYFTEDSIYKLTGETLYQITTGGRGYGQVTNTTDNSTDTDSTIKISMRKLTQRSDSSATYTVWRKRANRRVIDDLGFTFNSDVKSGEKYEIAFTYDRPLEFKRDKTSGLLTSPQHPLSRLTVISAWSDTLADDGDTVYSDAVWGGFRWMNWAWNGITSSTSDDNNQFGFGYQDKFGDDWTRIRVVQDSMLLEQNIVIDTTFERGVADSTRLVMWGISTTVNLYLEFLKWIGRN